MWPDKSERLIQRNYLHFLRGFQGSHYEGTDTLDQRHHVGLAKLLLKQHQIVFPMPELTAVYHIIRAEQDADIAVALRFSVPSGTIWSPCNAVDGWVLPEIVALSLLGINLAVNRFLADPQAGRPAMLEPVNHTLAKIWMLDQFALRRTALLRALVRCHAEVSSILLGEGIICPEVAFDLPGDRRLVTSQDARHLGDRDLRKPPVFYSTPFLIRKLRVHRAHAIFLLLDNSLFSNRSRTSK